MKSTIPKLAVAAVIVLVVGTGIAVLNSSDDTGSEGIGEPAVQEDVVRLETAKTELAAELKKVEQLFASGDVKGLISVLTGDEYAYESKVAAANFLADIGDDSAIAELEKLSDEQIAEDGENPFAEAIESVNNRTEGIVAEGTETPTAPESETVAAVEKVSDELLQLLPAESLFCLRVNNFDSAVGTMDQYLAGVSPVPVGLSMLVRMQLAGLLGDPALNNINTQGNFAIFGVGLMSGQEDKSKQTGDMFIAALLPVTDYTKLVSENQNYSVPDANGISIIKVGGTVAPNKTRLAVRVGSYILISLVGNYENLVSMGKLAAEDAGLGASLDADEVNAATTEPVWAYGNIQQVSEVLGPVLVEGLEQMKRQIEKMNESGQGGPTPAVMNIYFGMLDVLLNEVEFFSVSIRPQANVCSMAVSMAAVPETLMAKMLAADISGAPENELLGYLQDGAIVNVGIRKNAAFWEEYSLSQFDMMSFLSEEGIPDETIDKLEKVISELVASAGDSGAISFISNSESQMPFAARYVIEVKDPQRWNKMFEDMMDLWNVEAESLTVMGIEGNYEIEQGVDSYKDVSIDAAKFLMKATDPNTDYGKMMDQVYAGGIDYRIAIVDDLCLCTLGCNSDVEIRELIDQVKAGGPKEIAPEFAAALALLTQPSKSDFVGTLNVVRYLNMASSMMQVLKDTSGAMAPPMMPQIDAPSSSNIAFAGKVGNGKITVETALPKEHMLEIKVAVEMMAQKISEAQQAAAEEAAGTVEDANSPDEVNDVNEPEFSI